MYVNSVTDSAFSWDCLSKRFLFCLSASSCVLCVLCYFILFLACLIAFIDWFWGQALPLMMLGRFIYGFGAEALNVLQSVILVSMKR